MPLLPTDPEDERIVDDLVAKATPKATRPLEAPDPYTMGRTDGDAAARKSIVMYIRRQLVSFQGNISTALAVRGTLADLAAEIERRDDER